MRRWFNDFLHDSEYERALAHARSRPSAGGDGGGAGDSTVSVWSQVRSCREIYTNVLWDAGVRSGCGPARGGGGDGGGGDGRGEGSGGVLEGGGDDGAREGGAGGGAGGGCKKDGCDRFADGVVRDGGGGYRGRDPARQGTRRLPPPLWPLCGVRSLTVWQRAWASRGLQVSLVRSLPPLRRLILWLCRRLEEFSTRPRTCDGTCSACISAQQSLMPFGTDSHHASKGTSTLHTVCSEVYLEGTLAEIERACIAPAVLFFLKRPRLCSALLRSRGRPGKFTLLQCSILNRHHTNQQRTSAETIEQYLPAHRLQSARCL